MLWILLLLGACGVVGVMVYNRLVIAQNQYRNAFSQIGVQLQRRHDLIPNLVAAAKGYLKHENDTFTQVTQARNQAAGVLGVTRPENAEAVAQLSAAETQLTQAVRSLMVQIEACPDLQAAAKMRQLFPHSIVADYCGHRQPAQLLDFPDRAKHQAPPEVQF